MPLSPLASTLARISIIARTTSRGSGSPTPQACERTTFSCSSASSPALIRVSARYPTPVFTA
jgi:hypothetical protein